MLHYHHQRISSLRSTESNIIPFIKVKGKVAVFHRENNCQSALLPWVSHHLRTIILSLPAEVRKCPILKRPEKSLTQLVLYQVVFSEPEPRKGCTLPTSYPKDWKGPTSPKALHPGKMSQSLSPATLHNPSPKNRSINSYHQP